MHAKHRKGTHNKPLNINFMYYTIKVTNNKNKKKNNKLYKPLHMQKKKYNL